MTLPAHRVVGHREYGNRAPGWPGRKSDPTYSMNWRRHRVANFRPRTAPKPQEDELDATEKKMLKELHAAITAPIRSGNDPKTSASLRTYVGWIDTHAYELNREKVPALEKRLAGLQAAVETLATAAAGGDEVTADQLRAVVREEMAKVVQVEVSVVGDDPTP